MWRQSSRFVFERCLVSISIRILANLSVASRAFSQSLQAYVRDKHLATMPHFQILPKSSVIPSIEAMQCKQNHKNYIKNKFHTATNHYCHVYHSSETVQFSVLSDCTGKLIFIKDKNWETNGTGDGRQTCRQWKALPLVPEYSPCPFST